MPVSVTMPRLGESVTEGTVTRWLKQEGEHVEADEPLLEVCTDKVDTEIPSPGSGVLRASRSPRTRPSPSAPSSPSSTRTAAAAAGRWQRRPPAAPPPARAPPGRSRSPATPQHGTAAYQPQPAQPSRRRRRRRLSQPPPASPRRPPTGRPQAASRRSASTSAGPPAAQVRPQPAYPATTAAPARPAAAAQFADDGDGPYVTPLVRKLAAEHGIDLAAVTGTGVGGRIRKQDVLDAAAYQRGPRRGSAAAAAASRHRRRRQRRRRAGAAAPAAAAPPRPSAAAEQRRRAGRPSCPPACAARTEKMSRLRQVIAQRMVESLQTIGAAHHRRRGRRHRDRPAARAGPRRHSRRARA